MAKSTCSTCEASPAAKRGLCSRCYETARRQALPECDIANCSSPQRVVSAGLCNAHYTRLKKWGDPLAGGSPKSPAGGPCGVDGCSRKRMYADGLCGMHGARKRINGRVGGPSPSGNRGAGNGACPVCEDPTPTPRHRFCSDRCSAYALTHGVAPYPPIACAQCGVEVPRFKETRKPRRIDTALCDSCAGWDANRFGVSVEAIYRRDDGQCQLCGFSIDFDTPYPDPRSKSVDHVTPRSLGGSHDPSNLQLACLVCNIRRGNRLDAPVESLAYPG